MKNIKFIYLLLIPFILLANPIESIYKKALYEKIDNFVQKENNIVLYYQNYLLNNFDNNITRKNVSIYNDLDNSYFNNFNNESCDLDNSYCSETNGIEINITPKQITLKNSINNDLSLVSNLIKNIYYTNSFNTINSYVDTNNTNNKIYINDDIISNAIKLQTKLYSTIYYKYISTTIPPAPTLPIDGIWLFPNGINGVDLYLYDGTNWVFNNTIGFNENNPYILKIEDETLFNPLTFPGVENMKLILNSSNNAKEYVFTNDKWIEKGVNSTTNEDFSNILNLVTKDLLLAPTNIKNIKSNIFFNKNEKVTKFGIDLNSSFYKNDDVILANTFTTAINNRDNNQKYLFYANSDNDDYIPMMLKDGKYVYLSKTNNFLGVLNYPYNKDNNNKGPNIGTDNNNTDHLILSWDGFDKQSINNNKIYFSYNNSENVFYSQKNYDNSINNSIQISNNRTNFTTINDTYTYYSLYSNCNVNTNLGDNICHNNGLFAGDKVDNLYKWYSINNLLYDAHLVNSFDDMYKEKNNNNLYYNLVLYNNELYELVQDNNNNFCYKNKNDNKIYTIFGKSLSLYDGNGKAILPIDETCETVKLYNNKLTFQTLYDLLQNFKNAPNGTTVYVISEQSEYTKIDNGTDHYWENSISKKRVFLTRDDITNTNDTDYLYLSLYLGNNSDNMDINQSYRYTDTGIEYKTNNNNILYEWFPTNTTKNINTLSDIKTFKTLNDAYTSNEKNKVIFVQNDNKIYKLKEDNNIYCYMDEYGDFYTLNNIKIPTGKNGYLYNTSTRNYTKNYCIDYTKKTDAIKNNVIYTNFYTDTPITTDNNTTKKVEIYNGYVVEKHYNVLEQDCGTINNCRDGYQDDTKCNIDIKNYVTSLIGNLPNGLSSNIDVYTTNNYDYTSNPKLKYWLRPQSCTGGIEYNGNWYIPIQVYSYSTYSANYQIISDGVTCPATSDFELDNGKCYNLIKTTKTIKSCSNDNYTYNKDTDNCEYLEKCYNYDCPSQSNYWNNNWYLNFNDEYSTCYSDDKINNACEIQDFYNVPKI